MTNVQDGTLCRAQSPIPGVSGAASANVSGVESWSSAQKLVEAARRTTLKLPGGMRQQFAALFSPINIAVTTAVMGAWAASQAFGVGEVVDVILGIVGVATMGWAAIDIAHDLVRFCKTASSANNDVDLDRASDALARVVTAVGMTVFIALLAKGAGKFRGGSGLAAGDAATPVAAEHMAPALSAAGAEAATGVLGPTADLLIEGRSPIDMAKKREMIGEFLRDHPSNDYSGMRSAPRQRVTLSRAALDERGYDTSGLWAKESSTVRGEMAREGPTIAKMQRSTDAVASKVSGFDLRKPASRRILPAGHAIEQYEEIGGKPGLWASHAGADRTRLGIQTQGRAAKRYTLTRPMEVIEGFADKFPQGKYDGVGGKGGEIQLLLPPDWFRYVR